MMKRKFEEIYSRAANATVQCAWGQGVYVGNGFLITAAHCFSYDRNMGAKIARGQQVRCVILTAQGERMYVTPVFIETYSDIAVLGPLNGQTFPKKLTAGYEDFCVMTGPVPLCRWRISEFPAKFRVHIRTHKKTWIQGETNYCGTLTKDLTQLSFSTAEAIKAGTSGGPIINDEGELVGVVSVSHDLECETLGLCPFPKWTLPAWIYRRICGAGKEA
jgi:Trypsin